MASSGRRPIVQAGVKGDLADDMYSKTKRSLHSQRIQEIVESQPGIDLADMSKKTGIAIATIYSIVKHGLVASSEKLDLICEYLGIEPHYKWKARGRPPGSHRQPESEKDPS
jgi:hypothetical protein